MDDALRVFWEYASQGKSYSDCLSAYESVSRNKHTDPIVEVAKQIYPDFPKFKTINEEITEKLLGNNPTQNPETKGIMISQMYDGSDD